MKVNLFKQNEKGKNKLLSLLLCGSLFFSKGIAAEEPSSEELFVKTFLVEGVVLPKGTLTLPKIKIDYTATKHVEIAKNLLGENIESETPSGLTRVIDQNFQKYTTSEGKELLVFQHGGIQFKNPFQNINEMYPTTRPEAEKVLEIFIDNFGHFPLDATLVSTSDIKHPEYQSFNNSRGLPLGYTYEYGRYFKDIPIKNDFVQAVIIGGRVFQFSFSWGLLPEEIKDTEEEIIPAWLAVKDAIEYAYKNFFAGKYYADVYVTKVQLIYTFNGMEEAWKKDEPKTLVPAWTVQINNKHDITIEAFSSQIIPIY